MKMKAEVHETERVITTDQGETDQTPIIDEVITVKELSTRSLTGEGLRSTDYLTVPCCCCSEKGHAMIERHYTREGGIIQKARCPYLSNLRILETTTTREGDMLIFDIKTGVLARAHDYDFRMALNTWNEMRMNGMIRKAPRWKIDKFETTLEEQCEMRRNGVVRREVTSPVEKGVLLIEEVTSRLVTGKGRRDRDYYTRPCQCCGEKGHSLLRSRCSKGRTVMEAMCPYITNPQLRMAVPANLGEVFVYEIRATVLAKLFKYNYVAAQCFLTEIIHNGPASMQRISGEEIENFKTRLKEYCLEKRGEALWKELQGAPCRGCGSPFHGLLVYDPTVGKHRYNCPCMIQEEGSLVEWYEDRRTRYQLCPLRLAKEYRYDERRIVTALNRHTERGAGRFMKPETLSLLRDRALAACRGWGSQTVSWTPGHGEHTIRIMGMEEWKSSKPKATPITDTPRRKDTNGKVMREGMRSKDQSLTMMALGILVALLLYLSNLLTISPATEVIPYNGSRQLREPEFRG